MGSLDILAFLLSSNIKYANFWITFLISVKKKKKKKRTDFPIGLYRSACSWFFEAFCWYNNDLFVIAFFSYASKHFEYKWWIYFHRSLPSNIKINFNSWDLMKIFCHFLINKLLGPCCFFKDEKCFRPTSCGKSIVWKTYP